ncbi:TetR/AcrR family transcriptional regulator [Cryptosporangium minutisporangium]|uniref:TetR/AcrR family transcriptional regulator n=1 Tax=Cryptosporangium minutisporangium TaxID=113569 RepID=UPI0031E58CBD
MTAETDARQGANRVARRKARTRQALITAARDVLASGGSTDLSVQELTEAADVGLGSFYNHFTSKAELFEAAVLEVLEQHGQYLDDLLPDVEDPAEVFAASVRLTGRLVGTHPHMARILARSGMAYLEADRGLAPRALRDIERGIASGQFTVRNAYVALASTAGSLLAFLHLRLSGGDVVEADADELAEQVLRMLGMPPDVAHEIAHRPLPDRS